MRRTAASGVAEIEISNGTRGRLPIDALRQYGLRVMRRIPALEYETVEIAFVGEKKMKALNARYRGKDTPTDVLSFTLKEAGGLARGPAGSIVICPSVAEKFARRDGMPLPEMLEELILHGMLHITGSDHETGRDHRAMERRKRRVLEKMGSGEKAVGSGKNKKPDPARKRT
jgi:probable rRNA maturation factor